MGLFDKITKPIKKAVKKVAQAPKKIVKEAGVGIKKAGKIVGDAPAVAGKIAMTPLTASADAAGSALGSIGGGLGKAANALLPAAQGLLGTYLNPTGYIERKEDFNTPPVITMPSGDGVAPTSSSFDFSSLMPILIFGGIGLVIFFIFKRKK